MLETRSQPLNLSRRPPIPCAVVAVNPAQTSVTAATRRRETNGRPYGHLARPAGASVLIIEVYAQAFGAKSRLQRRGRQPSVRDIKVEA